MCSMYASRCMYCMYDCSSTMCRLLMYQRWKDASEWRCGEGCVELFVLMLI